MTSSYEEGWRTTINVKMVRDPAHHWPRPSRGHSSCQPSHLERPRTRTADPAASRRCGHSGAQALALRRGGQQMPNALCALCADLARHPAAARHTKPGQPGTGRRVSYVRVSEPASPRAPRARARARARAASSRTEGPDTTLCPRALARSSDKEQYDRRVLEIAAANPPP